MENILITKDSKNKIRVVKLASERIENESGVIYLIHRSSGQKGGKMIIHEDLKITSGKVKRTIEEQCVLQYNSELKKYLDKGYKKLEDYGVTDLANLDDNKFLAQDVTNQNGVRKPMLAKVFDKNDPKNIAIKEWYIDRKYDGVRCLMFWDGKEIRTSSRGGGDYDIPTTYIRTDPVLIQLFKDNPKIILDGEIYRHGWYLSKISGLARLESLIEDHKQLQYHCYDIVDENIVFEKRNNQINELRQKYITEKVIFVERYKVHTYEEMIKYHNQFVSEGYEGAIIRDPNKPYKCGARDLRLQKIKQFVDGEFLIKGLVEGLRDEDMCFLMETKEGYEFKAKPIGTREEKQYYRAHINEMIGQMATIKYFGMTNTEHPVPNLPVMLNVRLQKDLDKPVDLGSN